MIKLVAKARLKPECVDKFKELAMPLVEASVKEEGCISYQLCQDVNHPHTLTFVEEWADEAAIAFHNATPHFTSTVPQFGALLAEPMELDTYVVIK